MSALSRILPRPSRRLLLGLSTGLLLLLLMAAIAVVTLVRGSLPQLDGERRLGQVFAPVVVERDDHGVVRVRGRSRGDVAFTLGFLHGQERFFQMDLMRRRAGGRLAELFGGLALELDRRNRRHDFTALAEKVLAQSRPRHRALLHSYTEGVNAGLDALRVRPFEYLLLRRSPEPWSEPDCVLVIAAMNLELSLHAIYAEATEGTVREILEPALAEFLLPRGNPWEAPLVGEAGAVGPIPDSSVVDLRTQTERVDAGSVGGDRPWQPRVARGSNSWAVGGRWSDDGRALLANDMHLGLGLPNIWYRATLEWATGGGEARRLTGATLPGTPAVIVGSNGRVAWGLTNSYGDWADLVRIELDPERPDHYRTPDGWRPFAHREEIIAVAGDSPDSFTVRDTRWGPLWDQDAEGRWRALRWTAHDVEAVNFDLFDLEEVGDVEEAVQVAARMGIPPQNFVCADADGRIAWTLAGRIPRRIGGDGRRPRSWADGAYRWEGYWPAAEQPRIVDPPEGRLWSANARVVEGEALDRVGDGGYVLGARARQIRDTLRELERADEAAMLALQLDDRALYLESWRQLGLASLESARRPLSPARAEFQRRLQNDWTGRASVESVGYRIVRSFRSRMIDLVLEALVAPCREIDPDFDSRWLPYPSAVAWRLLETEPRHLLDPRFESWADLRLAAVDDVMEVASTPSIDAYTWGARNTVRLEHALARAVPGLARWLALPPRELPGDSYMPRVQHPGHGASERMVVSPGNEGQALFHMPGGQSGHPLSPYFSAGHRDWEEGRSTPMLPGPTVHRLRLLPEGRRQAAE